ncbi:MAG: hypothetical protein IKH00_06235 [Bacteroidales bacterium]|nr:hypothetical protein [Bacteroidales bacterium]
MKIQKLFLSILAAASLFAGCKEPEPEPSIPTLTVGQTELSFEQNGGTGNITVTSNRPWTISTDADWLAFNPSNGNAADAPVTVTVTALANSSTDRTASFKVKTDFDFRTVEVSQKGAKGEDPNVTPSGSGTANDPYNVAAALEKAKSLQAFNNGDDPTSSNSANVYTAGKVVSVDIDPGYGNATYFISADGTSAVQLEVYRGKYLEGVSFTAKDQLKVGDEVVVYGTLVNFKGETPEYTAGSKLISVNGETKAPEIDYTKFPLTNVGAFIEKAAKGEFFRLKGKVSRFNAQYCSFDLTDDSGTIYVYSVTNKDEWTSKISNGGTVELAGMYDYYEKNSQHEVVNAQILSFEAGSGTGEMGEPKGTGTLEDPYNPAGAAAAVKDLTWTSNEEYESTGDVYVKGKISRIVDKGTYTESGTYGNASFFISEDGEQSGEFQVYRALYLGNKKFESGQTDIKVGDEVIIYGKLMNYRNNTPETVSGKCYLYSLNGVTGGDEPGPGPSGDPKGTGTLEDPYNPAGAAAAVKDLTWTSNEDYESTGDVYVKGKISRIADGGTYTAAGTYGNASFFISEDGEQSGEFQVYRALYLGNKKFEEGQTDIKVGDEVIIYGKLMNYRNNTPETVSGKCYLYSLNGVTGGDEPGPGGESEDLKTATIAEFLAAADSKTQPYKLTGKVSNIVNNTYGNFDLTDATGTVYVYGLVAKDLGGYGPNKANDKSFASIGIKEDDEITIIGYRETFTNDSGSKDEVVGAYYVSGASGSGETPGGDTPGGDTPGDGSAISWKANTDWTGVADKAQTITLKAGTYTISAAKASGKTNPTVNEKANDCRVYAAGTVTITTTGEAMTSIVFTISSQGQKRLTDITANTGTVAKQAKGDKTVKWTGSAKTVTFTVGAKAVYGSDGAESAGQFDFSSIEIK